MKLRFISLLLLVAFAFVLLASCDKAPEDTLSLDSSDMTSKSVSDDTSMNDGIPDFYANALKCIEDKDYKQAYTQLYMIKGEEKAQKLLEQFYIKIKKEIDPKLENGFVEYTYDEKGNLVKSSDSDVISKYYYDDKGNLVKHEKIDANDTLIYVRIYKYDSENRLVFDEKEEKNEYSKQTWQYDDKGRLVKETSEGFSIGSIFAEGTTTYVYDDNGLLKTKSLDRGFSRPEIYTYEYYGNGLLKSVRRDSDAIANSYEINTYEYDEKGNLIKHVQQKDPEINLETTTFEYEYDDQNRLVKECKTSDPEGREYYDETRYTYDENGNLVEKYNDTTYKRTYYYYEYDAKSQLIKETTYPFPNYKTIVTYEYDLHGNIAKKNTYNEETEETNVIEYQYEYFFIPK